MLMPILTARTPAQTAQAALLEAGQPRDRLQALALAISGPRAEAILKILETLGRHLNGSEVLPKEALVKLMETLARILKFPPLPQETTHDFSQRLAGFLEKLPPEARIVLEKQLGQRNLALQVRVLAQVLDNPARPEAGSLRAPLQNAAFLTNPARTEPAQQARSPLPQPALAAQHLATLTAGSAPRMFGAPVEPALLQAVLRETFGSETEQSVPAPDMEDGEIETDAATPSRLPRESAAGTGETQQTGNTAATRATTTADAMPQLRAAAAFLAADPEALSLVSAIAQGEIDPQVEMAFASQAQEDPPAGTVNTSAASTDTTIESVIAVDIEPETTIARENDGELRTTTDQVPTATRDENRPISTSTLTGQPAAKPDEAEQPIPSLQNETQGQDTQQNDPSIGDEGPAEQIGEQRPEKNLPSSVERPAEKPVRILAETLKGLVQNTLPLPEGAPWATAGLPRQTMTGAAAASAVGLQPLDTPGLEAMLDAATVESTNGWTAELSDEIDSWVAQADAGIEDRSETRPAWTSLPKPDDALRDPLLHNRMLEGLAGRDAIPFAIIPYLPAKTEDSMFAEPAEEQQPSTDDETAGEQAQDEQSSTPRDEEQATPQQEEEAVAGEDDTIQDAYALYMRMGGLG